MRLFLAQTNPKVGDVRGNSARILAILKEVQAYPHASHAPHAACVVFPEQALCGYPSEDLLLSSDFLALLDAALQEIILATRGLNAIIGTVRRTPMWEEEKGLRNSAAICIDGRCIGFQDKTLLPNYGVFRERRYFSCEREPLRLWSIAGKKVAITICEDIWQYGHEKDHEINEYETIDLHYPRDPLYPLQTLAPDVLINLSASPYHVGRPAERLMLCRKVARYVRAPVALCNQVGANDGLLFDGSSLVISHTGECLAQGPFCQTALLEVNTEEGACSENMPLQEEEELFSALVMGVRDYFNKTGHTRACIGLSGGVDSALTACIATEALGAENVMVFAMPSRFSSPESLRDAQQLAGTLGISCTVLPIEEPFGAFCSLLRPVVAGMEATMETGMEAEIVRSSVEVMEENVQSRIRGTLLMSMANAKRALVLATGNKSELAMGYTTLYGDLCGALAVIGDLTKRRVYALARYVNREREVIPLYTLQRPPTAELRPNQLDSDTLPEYSILDGVVEDLVERQWTCLKSAQIRGIPLSQVQSIANQIERNEYKRKQAPIILRVTPHCFGVGRNMPVVQGFYSG